ncbi:hypothetical protein [uncultured Megasphaera sp.]|nr:hypothetical protein [uncultured Megasphaera sp.]
MVLRGHRLDYFFGLNRLEKIFCYEAVCLEQQRELDLATLPLKKGGR